MPIALARACDATGRPYALFAIDGEVGSEVATLASGRITWGGVGRTLALLREARCEEIVFVGKVRRPDFRKLDLDWRGVSLLPRVVAAARRGDDALLRTLGEIFEQEGFRLVGAEAIAGDLLAPAGAFGRHVPDEAARRDMRRAIALLEALGPHDVGQAAVVVDGHVLAIEAAEGTDAMLARCLTLPDSLRGSPEARRGVLVKLLKAGQERRIDLPTVGVRTVEAAAAAGLAGITVAAGSALVMERAAMTERADALGLFVYGLSDKERG